MKLHYFDFDPPAGWNGFRVRNQIRLVPPNTPPDRTHHAIVVSPLVPRTAVLPPAATLIQKALAAETNLTGAKVEDSQGPQPVKTDTGLAGVCFDVRVRIPAGLERRLYVMYADEVCYYGISYLAEAARFDEHVEAFWTAARSIKPFAGKLVDIPPDFAHYTD